MRVSGHSSSNSAIPPAAPLFYHSHDEFDLVNKNSVLRRYLPVAVELSWHRVGRYGVPTKAISVYGHWRKTGRSDIA